MPTPSRPLQPIIRIKPILLLYSTNSLSSKSLLQTLDTPTTDTAPFARRKLGFDVGMNPLDSRRCSYTESINPKGRSDDYLRIRSY